MDLSAKNNGAAAIEAQELIMSPWRAVAEPLSAAVLNKNLAIFM